MAIAKQNLQIDQGATYINEWTWQQNGVTVDLTNFSARGQIRKTFNSSVLLDLTEYITLGDETGTVNVEIPDTATTELDWTGYARYDIELEEADGTVYRFLEGIAVLSRQATHD